MTDTTPKTSKYDTYVFTERPRCPTCRSETIKRMRTLPRETDGSQARLMICTACGQRFTLVEE
jgi:DNA-directed RNA polymerase subunit M/transcription elongation factor TFIIS